MNWFLDFWYFHIPNYLLAALMYTLLGRMALGMLVPHDWNNYIWRSFVRLTDPVLRVVATVTPGMLRGFIVPLSAFWIFGLRVGLLVSLVALGLGPSS